MSPKVWYWWNTKTGQCTVCRLCSPPELVRDKNICNKMYHH